MLPVIALHGVKAPIDNRHRLNVQIRDADLVKVWVHGDGVSTLTRTWNITPMAPMPTGGVGPRRSHQLSCSHR